MSPVKGRPIIKIYVGYIAMTKPQITVPDILPMIITKNVGATGIAEVLLEPIDQINGPIRYFDGL